MEEEEGRRGWKSKQFVLVLRLSLAVYSGSLPLSKPRFRPGPSVSIAEHVLFSTNSHLNMFIIVSEPNFGPSFLMLQFLNGWEPLYPYSPTTHLL